MFMVNNLFDSQYRKVIVLGVGAVVIVACAGQAYRWYTAYGAQRDQQMLAVSLKEVQEAQEASQDEAWAQAQESLTHAYGATGGSGVSANIIGLQAHTLVQQGKLAEALAALDQLLAKMSSSSPLYSAYQIERALIALDLDDASGIAQLQKVADDANSLYRDKALYYIGSYYWSKDDQEAAKAAWQKLMELDAKSSSEHAKSPWAAMAREKGLL